MGPKGISRVVNQGLTRQNRQGFLAWTVDRDGQFCYFGRCGSSLDPHYAEWHGDLCEPKAWESSSYHWLIACGMVDLISKPAWRYTIGDTPNLGSFCAAKMTPFWDPYFSPRVVNWRPHISLPMSSPDPISSRTLRYVP